MIALGVVELALIVVAVMLLSSQGGRRALARLAFVALIVLPIVAVMVAYQRTDHRSATVATVAEVAMAADPLCAEPSTIARKQFAAPGQFAFAGPLPPTLPNVPAPPRPKLPPGPAQPVGGEPAMWLKIAILVTPFLVLLAAFAAIQRRPRIHGDEHRTSGLGWLAAATAVLVLVGVFSIRTVRTLGPSAPSANLTPDAELAQSAADRAQIDLQDGDVRANAIGACVQVDGYDISRLTAGVAYQDNDRNVESTFLPVPDGGAPLAGL